MITHYESTCSLFVYYSFATTRRELVLTSISDPDSLNPDLGFLAFLDPDLIPNSDRWILFQIRIQSEIGLLNTHTASNSV
jgi:hypothetical protein